MRNAQDLDKQLRESISVPSDRQPAWTFTTDFLSEYAVQTTGSKPYNIQGGVFVELLLLQVAREYSERNNLPDLGYYILLQEGVEQELKDAMRTSTLDNFYPDTTAQWTVRTFLNCAHDDLGDKVVEEAKKWFSGTTHGRGVTLRELLSRPEGQ